MRTGMRYSQKLKSVTNLGKSCTGETKTIFDKIINKEIPAKIIYEDKLVLKLIDFVITFFSV